MIRFIENDTDGFPLKRKQNQRACEKCRKRKKKCPHYASVEQGEKSRMQLEGENQLQISGQIGAQINVQNSPGHHSQIVRPTNTISVNSTPLDTITTEDDEDNEDRDLRFVGELNPEGTIMTGASPGGTTAAQSGGSPEDVVGVWVPRKFINAAKNLRGPILSILLPYLEDELVKAMPDSQEFETIYRMYVDEIHPILPIMNLENYQKQQGKIKTILKLAICLSVCSNPKISARLRKPPKEFSNHTAQLLRTAIDNGLIRDKQIIIQLLAILAFSIQLSDEHHASAEFLYRAVSYVHTTGLHLDTTTRNDHAYTTKLFCCVFVVDRLNACIQGRPVLMHERDIGRDLKQCAEQQDSLFQLVLHIVLLLDEVITLYRPSRTNKVQDSDVVMDLVNNFPAFEDLISACGTMRAPAALIATVETLYHAVAMLSCRSQSLNEISRSSTSNARQNLSAASIVSIISTEFKGQMSVLPFVPYALSLALRVSYRDLRLSKSNFSRTRARRQLLQVCTLLRELGEVFSSSIHMAQLAEQTVCEMDKAYATVANRRRQSMIGMAAGSRQSGQLQATAATTEQEQVDSTYTSEILTLQEHSKTAGMADIGYSRGDAVFDSANFDLDLDVFEHFDPGFNFEVIDAALGDEGLSTCLPMDMIDWSSTDTQQFNNNE